MSQQPYGWVSSSFSRSMANGIAEEGNLDYPNVPWVVPVANGGTGGASGVIPQATGGTGNVSSTNSAVVTSLATLESELNLTGSAIFLPNNCNGIQRFNGSVITNVTLPGSYNTGGSLTLINSATAPAYLYLSGGAPWFTLFPSQIVKLIYNGGNISSKVAWNLESISSDSLNTETAQGYFNSPMVGIGQSNVFTIPGTYNMDSTWPEIINIRSANDNFYFILPDPNTIPISQPYKFSLSTGPSTGSAAAYVKTFTHNTQVVELYGNTEIPAFYAEMHNGGGIQLGGNSSYNWIGFYIGYGNAFQAFTVTD